MGRLGISGGDYVDGLDVGDAALIPRHGDPYVQPHRIDHAANMRKLLDAGCDRVLALGSVGGLHRELDVGTFVCPDDFIALHAGRSAFDDRRSHLVPGFDAEWRGRVLGAWSGSDAIPLRDGGVYWESIGPRFETRAEIRLIARHADVIGMTIASECVIAGELGLPYAAVCIVDNLANGVAERELTVEEFQAGRARNRERLGKAVGAIVPALEGEEL
ncbi:MAG TPA: MTAP family purine nucleoside phosphorylase [Solirubrobacterales bacterium]|nr:MTAP family purine nucleoside phosphorylase [Solirubrobacterales bacterium]